MGVSGSCASRNEPGDAPANPKKINPMHSKQLGLIRNKIRRILSPDPKANPFDWVPWVLGARSMPIAPGTSMVIEIRLLERRGLRSWLKRVKISTLPVQGVKFLTCLPRYPEAGLALRRRGLEVLAFDFFD